ncbi:T9SS type A sorting domain-containing protein [Streptomyces sp. NPDC000410]|uniref:T9SS type A sorting domain-containing protein n=1 Tax=Streptomyces sp. NPDC000410 TaxID=3154254 RepID=UPI003323B73A
MNRQQRLALLSPLLVSSVALAPAVAAHGASTQAPTSTSAAPSAVCKLEATAAADKFDIVLSDFPDGKPLAIFDSKGKLVAKGNADGNGKFDEEGQPRGNYSVKFDKQGKKFKKSVGCTKSPVKPADKVAEVTSVRILSIEPTTPEITCTPPATITVKAEIKTASPGKVKYRWDFDDEGRSGPKTETFEAAGAKTVSVNYPTDAQPAGSGLSVDVQAEIIDDGQSSQKKFFDYKCK